MTPEVTSELHLRYDAVIAALIEQEREAHKARAAYIAATAKALPAT